MQLVAFPHSNSQRAFPRPRCVTTTTIGMGSANRSHTEWRSRLAMTGFALPGRARALTTLRSIEWPIRRLGPYSCVVGFMLLGVVALGMSRALLIAWQWERVAVTDSVFSMLVQGLRSDLMTLGTLRGARRVAAACRCCRNRTRHVVGQGVLCLADRCSLVAILFLELATPAVPDRIRQPAESSLPRVPGLSAGSAGDALERLSQPAAAHGLAALPD